MPVKKLTPLMEQYYRIKEQYQDAILLFRIGDFYETFGQDAETISRDLNITLTSRQKDDDGNRIPLAGVPHHSLEVYLAKLIKAGHTVAICDQVEDPKLAKGLVKREITRVVTPGTIIEPCLLDESSNNFLAAIINKDERSGLALVDVSTGEFLTTEIKDDRFITEIYKFRPAECLIPKAFPLALECSRIQVLEDDCFSLDNAFQAMESQFGPSWIDKFRLNGKELCIRACGAVLSHLRKSHLGSLDHINQIRLYSMSDFMLLDGITLRNLEILRNIRDGSRRGTLFEFFWHTRTSMGARILAKWIQMPLLSLEPIQRRLDAVDELIHDSILRKSIAEELKGTSDLERLVGRICCRAATPKDLVSSKKALQRLPPIFQILENSDSLLLRDLREQLSPLEEEMALIEKAMNEEPPINLRDGGVIREGFDPELDLFRKTLRDSKDWIAQLEGKERKRTGIKSLKVGYTTVFGYYIEVSRPNLHLVPEDYIRKQTLTNHERFITSELKDEETKILSAQERLVDLEQELFESVRARIAEHAQEIQSRASALGELDVLLAYAEAAVESSFIRPEFNKENNITIRGSRHPILDRIMHGSFVPNDVCLDNEKNRLIILTGPNMAGKSTFMRQIALTLIMAQAGSFVPASFASLTLVDRIFTRVGAFDDLSAGQSTFMVEMMELANILGYATEESLVLLDEVGRGTSTFDGLSIAWAISEYLHNEIKCKAIFATHYHQLTQLEIILPGVKNYSIAVKENKGSITFLRTIVPGATDKSYGVHVARLAGVPDTVTRRADEILKDIEENSVLEPISKNRRGRKSPRYTQLIFFDHSVAKEDVPPQTHHPILKEILKLDTDALTPREALDKLADYQKRLFNAQHKNLG